MSDVNTNTAAKSLPVDQILKAVIFDCDGVLVDSEPVYAEAFSQTLMRFGCHLPASLLQSALHGKSINDCYAWLAKHWQFTVTVEFEKTLFANTNTLVPAMLKPIRHAGLVVESVSALKAVASNGARRSVEANLALCGLDHFFGRHIYTASQVAKPKPAPDVYLFAAKQLGVQPSACIVVEDSALGVIAAVRAGMQVFWLSEAGHNWQNIASLNDDERARVHSLSSMKQVLEVLGESGLAVKHLKADQS